MNTKVDDPKVVGTINELIGVVQWGVKDRNKTFIPLNVSKLEGDRLYYFDEATNSDKLVSHFHKALCGGSGERWLRIVWFKDGFGNEIRLKTHLEKKHGLHIK